MIVYLSKPMSLPRPFEVYKSTVLYKDLAQVLGFDPANDNPTLTVSVDCGRANSVKADDEMTVVEGMGIEINW